jgi:hypothetical protein
MMTTRRKLPQYHFTSTKNLKCSYPELNLGFHSKKTASSFFSQIKSERKYLSHVASEFQVPSRGLFLSRFKFQHELQNNCSLCTHTSTLGFNYLENPILTMVLRVMTPCSVVCGYQCFGGKYTCQCESKK